MDLIALQKCFPLIKDLQQQNYVFWSNTKKQKTQQQSEQLSMEMVRDAEERLQRFSSYIKVAFPAHTIFKWH